MLKNWNTPMFNILYTFLVGVNVALGVFQDFHGHRSWPNYLAAVIIAAVNVFSGLHGRRLRFNQILTARQREVLDDTFGDMTEDEQRLADRKAKAMLNRVVQAVGAIRIQGEILLTVGRSKFTIIPGYIQHNSPTSCMTTCFFVHGGVMPYAEAMATALLSLKHDPTVFFKWYKHNGPVELRQKCRTRSQTIKSRFSV